ncbi:MAG TPA: hypothetical protein VLB44_07625 [Kofleriaceae bacterium]|nr:hypothetical protein [Kofleriaceae bacterium]
MRALAIVIVVAACSRPAPRPDDEDLARYLRRVATLDGTSRREEVAKWRLAHRSFDRLVVVPFRDAYDGYDAHFAEHVAELATSIPATPAVRRHFAGDPRLSPSQGRLRWALPVMYPSYVADGIDTVFVRVEDHWYVLAGLDDAVLDRARTLDPACTARLAGPVTDFTWMIADAALRGDRERFARACQLVRNQP